MLTKQQLIELLGERSRRVHFIGIGGVGMSGLARLLIQLGHKVTGSDAAPNGLADGLRGLGATIQTGHARGNLQRNTELVISTAAVAEDNPELAAALEWEIPCAPRGLLLTALMNHRHNIAVAGTHGKTTTSSMITSILMHSDSAPSYCIGAHVPSLGSNAQLGAGKYFVAEACESDGTLINFVPDFSVCLNVEAEHLDHHGSMDRLLETFAMLFQNTREVLFYCADCPNCKSVAQQARLTWSFGLSAEADYRATEIEPTERGSRFVVTCRGERIGQVELRLPGRQNIVNALAAIAVADQLDIPFAKIAEGLQAFTGAKRRFEFKYDRHGIRLVDDYAHHPTEIRATLEAARTLQPGRLIAVFQPHRYTRTQALCDQFATAFTGADKLFLTDVYAASEPPLPGVDGSLIYRAVRSANVGRNGAICYEPDTAALAEKLTAELRDGDLVLVMGAGDIYRMTEKVVANLQSREPARRTRSGGLAGDLRRLLSDQSRVRAQEPMSRHTTMGVGGPAELWVEPWNEKDLSRLLRFCHDRQVPVTFIGRGTNLLVRDGGIAGVVIQLSSKEFARLEVDGDRIIARTGVRLKELVNQAKRHELGGFEFMEGIPGSLGGALRMNAGAMGRQTFEVVEWIRYMNLAGEVYDADARSVPVLYRNCPLLASHVAVSAILRGTPASRQTIEATLKDFSTRRWASQPHERSAGCVFKNPAALPAGKLIDELGLKGARVGGARVSEKHGNFVVNSGRATAADVLELIDLVRERVRQERGIELEPEVMILGRDK